MLHLVRVEVRRLTSRRLARVLAALVLAVLVVTMGRMGLKSNRDLAAAHRRADRQAASFGFDPNAAEGSTDCLPPGAPSPPPGVVIRCGPPGPSIFFHDPRFHLAREARNGTKGVGIGVGLAAFLLGASFIGAEWHAGTLQALLVWEPRRLRVLAAKAAGLVLAVLAFTVFAEAVHWAIGYGIAATRGTTQGLTAGVARSVGLLGLRLAAVTSFAALLGFAIAGLARVTGAALGAGFVYFAIVENVIRYLRPGWQRYLISENVTALVEKKTRVIPLHEEGIVRVVTLHGPRGAVTLGVYLAILLGVFAVTFLRRDVT